MTVAQAPQAKIDPHAKGQAISVQRTLNTVTLDVRVDAAQGTNGMLVVRQNYYPGWSALIDGMPAPILPVNYTLQGVVIGPGTHQVILRYLPSHFLLFVVMSCVGLVALIGCIVLPTGTLRWRHTRRILPQQRLSGKIARPNEME